jgi:hypothetical protein
VQQTILWTYLVEGYGSLFEGVIRSDELYRSPGRAMSAAADRLYWLFEEQVPPHFDWTFWQTPGVSAEPMFRADVQIETQPAYAQVFAMRVVD